MRIVSLLPAATEIVALLGATDHLVGITHECDYPDVVRSRARVTRSALPHAHDPSAIDAAVRDAHADGVALFTLDTKTITALHPTAILTQALCEVCAVREADVRALAARLAPPPAVVTLGGTSLDGIYADIRAVARAIGADDEADELLAGLRDRVEHVHRTLKAAQAPRPRVALVEWTDPLYVAGHWGPEQIARAGGIDVLGVAAAHSVPVAMDALRKADPEIVLFAPCGYTLEQATAEGRRCLALPQWQWLEGRQVWALDANGLISRPGPRVVEGIEAMASIIAPTLFSEIEPWHAVRLQ
ncbi:ABC transporter substrate-binding protein [Gemmatimonas sp.]|uniref:ABC transporter substrate-binding protein n=1 Tax=Gemmatimonas sp. TaxID=1962908 RepID=UPI0025C047AF|nr:ABC transporter substrate-binding protein [Gemmatimonas sp.]MCA2982498.1 ABC transporter substrate-binding protein [Gemmatimonas sp.]MCA2996567.1 ABC transporter substrate-binding protein [Gemmatimonas sp.]